MVGSAAGKRYTVKSEARIKETTAVRRKGRVYFFIAISQAADEEARRLLRETIANVTWTK